VVIYHNTKNRIYRVMTRYFFHYAQLRVNLRRNNFPGHSSIQENWKSRENGENGEDRELGYDHGSISENEKCIL
jgi:hypothetical protein